MPGHHLSLLTHLANDRSTDYNVTNERAAFSARSVTWGVLVVEHKTMNTVALIVAIEAYRLASIFVGFAIIYFGYKLFDRGVYQKAGELKAAWGESNLLLKQAAPGTFFVIFGTAVIVFSLWKGFSLSASPSIDDDTLVLVEKAAKGEALNAADKQTLLSWTEKQKTQSFPNLVAESMKESLSEGMASIQKAVSTTLPDQLPKQVPVSKPLK